MPVSALERTQIHRCPEGYHIDAIKKYCADHGLPVGNWSNVVALASKEAPTDDNRVIWCKCMFEVLWRANLLTKAVILPGEHKEVWEFFRTTSSAKIIVIGSMTNLCHVNVNSWDEAVEIGCQKM